MGVVTINHMCSPRRPRSRLIIRSMACHVFSRMEVWISHSSLKETQSVTIQLDYVDKAIKEAERRFSFDESSLSAKFNGRTLCRDSSVPETTSQKPLELFKGMH